METLGGEFGKKFGVVGNMALQGVGEPWSLPFTIFHTLAVMRAVLLHSVFLLHATASHGPQTDID